MLIFFEYDYHSHKRLRSGTVFFLGIQSLSLFQENFFELNEEMKDTTMIRQAPDTIRY